MINFLKVSVLIFTLMCLSRYTHCTKRNKSVKTYNRTTGEATAIDKLIQIYEREHLKLNEKENRNGSYMMWSALVNKNLTHYCRKYLQHSIPTRTTDDVFGILHGGTLYYEKESTSSTSKIVIVQCKIIRQHTLSYYITRAPEPNCVYALRCINHWKKLRFSIIHKYCDFEDKPFREKLCKWKRTDNVDRMIYVKSSEPIAKDDYLLEYELEHQKLIGKDEKGKYIQWTHAMKHHNLHYYCYQYVKECVLRKKPEGIKGSWKIEKLNYKKLCTNMDINVVVVKCQVLDTFKQSYHLTRSPETNCVYAVAQPNPGLPFVITFKHCNFVEEIGEKDISQDCDMNVIPKTEVKEEILDTLDTMQLFAKY